MNLTEEQQTTSRYRGVCWDKRRLKWTARETKDGTRYWLGYFDSEVAAADAIMDFWHKRGYGSREYYENGPWLLPAS